MKVPSSTPDNLKTDVFGPRCNTSRIGRRFSSMLSGQEVIVLGINHRPRMGLSPLLSPCVFIMQIDKMKLEILLTGCSGGSKSKEMREDWVNWWFPLQQKMCKADEKVARVEKCANETLFVLRLLFLWLLAKWCKSLVNSNYQQRVCDCLSIFTERTCRWRSMSWTGHKINIFGG